MEIGRQDLGTVGCSAPDLRPRVILNDLGADLGVPDNLDLLALRVVGNAGEPQRRQRGLTVVDRFNEPWSAAHFDELTLLDRHFSSVRSHLVSAL